MFAIVKEEKYNVKMDKLPVFNNGWLAFPLVAL